METTLGPIKAVVFDMDGVLLDTEPLYGIAMDAACTGLGYTLSEKVRLDMIGIPIASSNQLLLEAFGADFPLADFDRKWRVVMNQRLATGIPVKTGAEELLVALRANDVPRALATSTKRDMATEHLTDAGLIGYFDKLVTRDDVTNGKPDPEPYLLAAERLGLAPKDCLAIEDSFNGIRSAHAAGMKPVMVPDLLTPDDEMRTLCAAIMPSLNEVRSKILGFA